MNTPICDFVASYAQKNPLRFHMPGHKGIVNLGVEHLDITEVAGADDLSRPDGIILESENNATALFGTAHTYYATGGSSQSIRAMVYLAMLHGKGCRKIVAGRNAHKAFLYAAALLDLEVVWLYPEHQGDLCACQLSVDTVAGVLAEEEPFALYLTSPDYLGGVADIGAMAQLCQRYDIPLLVDNAHGAYLHFLHQHPMDLGATMCADSAHKTLPVLTGGSYLHINDPKYLDSARQALGLFGSTSPSYLILQSLDRCNAYLSQGYDGRLNNYCNQLQRCREDLTAMGFVLEKSEPLKLTFSCAPIGCTGKSLAAFLLKHDVVSEYADAGFMVLMCSVEHGQGALERLKDVLSYFPIGTPISLPTIPLQRGRQRCSIRQGFFSLQETVPVSQAVGRICGAPVVSCPPAIPLVVSGEEISQEILPLFAQFGIETLSVIRT